MAVFLRNLVEFSVYHPRGLDGGRDALPLSSPWKGDPLRNLINLVGLTVEFPELTEAVSTLKANDAHFTKLLAEHDELDKQITKDEEGLKQRGPRHPCKGLNGTQADMGEGIEFSLRVLLFAQPLRQRLIGIDSDVQGQRIDK